MATKTALVATAYTQVAADVTALTIIQCPSKGSPTLRGVELVVAGSLPAVTVRGVELAEGETIIESVIPSLGATGALYAKPAWGSADGEVLTA